MTSFKKIAVTSAVLATTLVAGVLSPVAVHADELTKVQAQSQNNATGDAPVVVTDVQTNAETTEAPKTEAAATPATNATEDTSKANTETNDTASKKDTQEQKKAEAKPVQRDTVKAPDKADFDRENPNYPKNSSYQGDGKFIMGNGTYNNDQVLKQFHGSVSKDGSKIPGLKSGLSILIAPALSDDPKNEQWEHKFTQTISVLGDDGKLTTLRSETYSHQIIAGVTGFALGQVDNGIPVTFTATFNNTIREPGAKPNELGKVLKARIVKICYDPITNKLVQENGSETGSEKGFATDDPDKRPLTQAQLDFLTKGLTYTFQEYDIPQKDGYITYYSNSDKFDSNAKEGTKIAAEDSIDKNLNWYVFYVKKPEDKTPADNNKHEDQNPPKNDPENKNPKDQTSSKEDPVDPTIIVDPVIPAEDPVVVEKPDAEVVKPEETPDLPEAPEPAKEPEKVEVIAPAATVQAPAPAVVKAAPQAVKAAPAAKKLPQTGNSQTIKAAGLALVSLGLLGLAFADLKKKRA